MIEVHELRKTYPGGVEAVRGIDFDVAPGEVFGLLGPNGAGKSTTIGVLTTGLTPTSGRATVASYDVAADPIGARHYSAVVFQEPSLDRGLTGRRNLEIHARLWGLDPSTAAQRIDMLADTLGIVDVIDRPAETCSGGQRRRIEIARALVSQPRVLFLDEPTVGLDPRIRFELLDVIATLRNETELTIVLTTHYLDEAERLCDRVAIMHEGLIVAIDTPSALLAVMGEEIIDIRVDGDVTPSLAILRASGLAGDDTFTVGNTLSVPLHGRSGMQAMATLRDVGLVATSVAARRPNLDDVYLRLTGSSLAA